MGRGPYITLHGSQSVTKKISERVKFYLQTPSASSFTSITWMKNGMFDNNWDSGLNKKVLKIKSSDIWSKWKVVPVVKIKRGQNKKKFLEWKVGTSGQNEKW